MLIEGSRNNAAFSTPAAPALDPQNMRQHEPRIHGRTAAQRADRNARDARRLAAVSGVVIPSKVPPGHLPNQGRWDQNEMKKKIYPCSICGRRFVQRHQVQVHMAPCVERNGNPNGVRWNDAWKNHASQAVSMNAHPNGLQGLQLEDAHADDQETEDEQPYEHRPADYESVTYRPEDHELHDLPSSDLQRDQPHLQSDTKLVSSPLGYVMPYDPNLRMDHLTNGALLAMGKAWEDAMHRGEKGHSAEHPHFQMIMYELWMRDMIDSNSIWIVNPARVNMFWRRTLVESPRST